MKVYIDEKDIGTTITYKEENGKKEYIYCHDREGFVFKDLADYTKQVRKEVCEEIRELANKHYGEEICGVTMETILDQIQGETK